MVQQIVGIDCATQPGNTGLARALRDGPSGPWRLEAAQRGRKSPPPAETVAGWRADRGPTLIALDSPLGWPHRLSLALGEHRAGEALSAAADAMFLRDTDRVARRSGCAPFSVGADRIARTAHSTLQLIAELRTHAPIGLAWDPGELEHDSIIEVYPKATLRAHGLWQDGTSNDARTRGRILDNLPSLTIGEPWEAACLNPHVFDAVICVQAAIDFVNETVLTPAQAGLPKDIVEREGFIWIRRVA